MKNYPVSGAFLFLLLILTSAPLHAEPRLNTSLSANRINSSETVLLTIQAEWLKSEGAYGFALPEPGLVNLSLIRRGESQEFFTREGSEWVRKTFEMELKPLGAGAAEVRDFTVTAIEQTSRQTAQFQVSAMRLAVEKMPGFSFSVLTALAGAFLLLALGTAAAVLAKKKRSAVSEVKPLSEQERRVSEIRSITGTGTLSKDKFHSVTAQFRGFLSEHYKTGSQTTEDELIRILKIREIPFEEWRKIKLLLEKIQEAKYLPESSAGGSYKYLQQEILSFIESKKSLEPLSGNSSGGSNG